MGQLILVRHGKSIWNLENRFTGWIDVELSDIGIEEAKKVGKNLNVSIGYVFTSDLKRAIKTAEIIIKESNQNPIVFSSKNLRERNYGDLQGLNKNDVLKKYGEETFKAWRRSYKIAPPNGESLEQTKERVVKYYIEYIKPILNLGENVLISAHGNSLRALIMYLENISEEDISELNIETCVPYVYNFSEKLIKKV